MKIIYLHQYFNTPDMSGGTRSYEMAKRMVAAGHKVHMVTSSREEEPNSSKWSTTNESGITVHWYPVLYSNHMSYAQRIKAFLSFAHAAKKKASSLQGDIVFATSTPLTIAIPAVFTARKLKVPMVFEVRDLWPEMPIAMGALNNPALQFAAKKLERWAYKNAAAVVALSPGMKQGVVNTGFPTTKVAVIPNSSDNTDFAHNEEAAVQFRAQRSWLTDDPLLVYTGTFGKVNGVGYMVQLASELKRLDSKVKILLVGDGAEKPAVISQAKAANIFEDNLFIESAMPKKEIPALLSAATMSSALFIDLPEMRPNSANKFFDALASGTPVFLNYGGWMHDLTNTHRCGITGWQQPIQRVAEQLDEKMNDDEWLKKAGLAARKLAEDEFDRDKLAEQLISVLNLTVQGKVNEVAKIAPGIYS